MDAAAVLQYDDVVADDEDVAGMVEGGDDVLVEAGNGEGVDYEVVVVVDVLVVDGVVVNGAVVEAHVGEVAYLAAVDLD